jgi:hypothetical membrane protein
MLRSQISIKQRAGAIAGMMAPVLAFACILTAIASDPGFSWTKNALSDLGIVPGITGPLFNFGLYASGLLALSFALFGLLTYMRKSVVGKVGFVFFAAATLALIAIGVFNESFSGTHYDVSVAFFVLIPMSLFILTCSFLLDHKGRLAVFTVLIGIIAALPWLLFFAFHYVPNVAIPETVSGLAVSTWTMTLCVIMLKGRER